MCSALLTLALFVFGALVLFAVGEVAILLAGALIFFAVGEAAVLEVGACLLLFFLVDGALATAFFLGIRPRRRCSFSSRIMLQ